MSVLYWDLETLAQPAEKILAALPPWDEEEAKTRIPKNYKNPEAISGWLEQDRYNRDKEVLEKAALNPEHATIAVSGFLDEDGVYQLGVNEFDETRIVKSTITLLDDTHTVLVWNLAFDIRMIVQRAWLLGVPVPRSIYNPLARYPIPERFVCLMEKWGVNRGASYSKLQNVAKALGLEGKTGDGKDFGKLWAEDPVKALEYNAQDLRTLQAVAGRMGI